MIAFVRGPIAAFEDNAVVIDVNGIGYRVTMTGSALGGLLSHQGDCSIHTYTHVKEDALELFGFLETGELGAFKHLIGISGIGPRLAMQILGGITVSELVSAIAAGDIPRLKSLPGIGKKTAERLVIELRDKAFAGVSGSTAGAGRVASGVYGDLKSAMENLGYRGAKLEKAVQDLQERGTEFTLEEAIREALALLR